MAAATCWAQQARPKIGLALEGGSALGLAHVGVLEWLEENRIPIDAVAGTSMGGLVGGLYAAGRSPAELREIVKTAKWGELLGGESKFGDLGYRRKEDKIAYPNRVEFGIWTKGVVLPAALNEGHEIGLLFSRQLQGYGALPSFDELPTPFRCVATDLVSGKAVVIGKGSLPLALRSTMSLPALFSPVRKGREVYVDGGALDNLPVDVARRMGVDIVIAVHLNKGSVDAAKLGDFASVMGRSISVMVAAAEMRTIEQADVVLVADLEGVDSMAFQKAEQIANAGRAAAQAKANLLRRFSLDEEAYAAFARERLRKKRAPDAGYGFVEVSGTGPASDAAIKKELGAVLKSEGSAEEKLARFEAALTHIVGLGRVASMRYERVEREGKTGLDVQVSLRGVAPVIVNPAVEINGADTSNSRFSVGSRITWLDPWGFRSEWRNDIWFGARMGAATELYKPFRPGGRVFFAPRAYVDSGLFDVFAERDSIAEYRLRQQGVGGDLGWTLNRFSELRAGYSWNWIRARQRVGLPVFPSVSASREVARVRYNFEGQDDNIVPRQGLRFQARAEYYPRGTALISNYGIGEVRSSYLHRTSKQTSLLAGFSGGATLGPIQSPLLAFDIGGPQRLGAYGINELLVKQYAIGTVGGLYELKNDGNFFGSKVFLAGFAQGGRYAGIDNDAKWPANLTGAIVVKTFVGPMFLGGSIGDRGRHRWYFGVGRFF
jgi:NTE family protein